MRTSESIKEIATALAKFQAEVKNPLNVAENPFLKNKYAPLNEVLNTVRPILAKNGLSIVQDTGISDGNVEVTTYLFHESGEWLATNTLTITPEKTTPQGIGSIITYARRYALSALLGISSEDDDDANSQEKNLQEHGMSQKVINDIISEAQKKRMVAIAEGNMKIINYVLAKHKYEDIGKVAKKDYAQICKEIENAKKGFYADTPGI